VRARDCEARTDPSMNSRLYQSSTSPFVRKSARSSIQGLDTRWSELTYLERKELLLASSAHRARADLRGPARPSRTPTVSRYCSRTVTPNSPSFHPNGPECISASRAISNGARRCAFRVALADEIAHYAARDATVRHFTVDPRSQIRADFAIGPWSRKAATGEMVRCSRRSMIRARACILLLGRIGYADFALIRSALVLAVHRQIRIPEDPYLRRSSAGWIALPPRWTLTHDGDRSVFL